MGWRSDKKKRSSTRSHRLLARPLDSLFFLLPMIVFYEIVSLFGDRVGLHVGHSRVVAFYLLQNLFGLLGTSAFWMPGVGVVGILLATQAVSGNRWRFNKSGVAWMYAESIAWAVPLIAVNHLTQMASVVDSVPSVMNAVALSIGAGIYEELVFRLLLIALIVIIGADLLRFPKDATLVAAVFISAIVFALHHHPPFGNDPFNVVRFAFRTLAGVYLAGVFVFRGYGPAAGTHIAHNLLVIAWAAV